jgi:hypothetical protein
MDYQKARAIQKVRYEKRNHGMRSRHRRRTVPFGALLDALAGGLASVGVRQGGKTRPSSPAY